MLAIRDRFEGPHGRRRRPANYTVLTVPPELRAAAADASTWRKWRRLIWKYLKKNHGGLFAVERTDPAGDKAHEKWHPHLNLLWVQRDGFRPFIDVEALKAEWGRIMGAERLPVAHHAFSDVPARLNHWYSYMGRTWPDWQGAVRLHPSVRWLGKYPKKPPPEKNCRSCGGAVVFVSGLDRKGADELAALGPAAVRWEWEKREGDRVLSLADRQDKPRGRSGREE